MTQSECLRQSLSASRRPWQEEDMVVRRKRLGTHVSWTRLWNSSLLTEMALLKLPPAVRNILPTGPSVARLNLKSVLSVSGSQAPDFLHGILSSAVPTSNRPFFSAALNAQVGLIFRHYYKSAYTCLGTCTLRSTCIL